MNTTTMPVLHASDCAGPNPDPVAGTALLMRVLEEIDYGLLLTDADGVLRHANQLGLSELHGGGPLQLVGGRLNARHPEDQALLRQGLLQAQQGRRKLCGMSPGPSKVSVAFVPLPRDGHDEDTILLLFGRRAAAQSLTMDFYARTHGLTRAEAVVLRCICNGMRPKDIAREQCVAISTVRTHIASVRAKTQTRSIRDLLDCVAVLPPITPLMKSMDVRDGLVH